MRPWPLALIAGFVPALELGGAGRALGKHGQAAAVRGVRSVCGEGVYEPVVDSSSNSSKFPRRQMAFCEQRTEFYGSR